MGIDDMINNVKGLNFKEILKDSFIDTESDAIRLQREQMLRGENSEGNKIGKYVNKTYSKKKAAMNPLAGAGNVDLKLTGEMQSKITFEVKDEEVVFFSADNTLTDMGDGKVEFLVSFYGEVIFGLNLKSRQMYSPILQKAAIVRIKKQIYGLH